MSSPARILIVDDEAVCTYFLDAALREAGYSVRSTTRADRAVDIARAFGPTILITDWMLKDSLDGVDLARILLADDPHIKIIFITGMSPRLLEQHSQEIAYSTILEKPLDLNLVTQSIESALAGAETRRHANGEV